MKTEQCRMFRQESGEEEENNRFAVTFAWKPLNFQLREMLYYHLSHEFSSDEDDDDGDDDGDNGDDDDDDDDDDVITGRFLGQTESRYIFPKNTDARYTDSGHIFMTDTISVC